MRRVFTTIYFAGIVAEMVIRLPHERRRKRTSMAVDHVDRQERALLGLLFLGMFFLPVAYAAAPSLMKEVDYRWSERARRRAGMLGAALLAAAVWLFWRSHADLGRNWSPTLQLREEHQLVTGGVYRWVRHPMYASQWLWIIAQPLLLQNWVAGPAGSLLFLPLYILRVPREEQMLLDQFGDAYRAYMAQTGGVIPRLRR
jgi:protein-S-isoprenylcysteine O-methyltransferase Ste14